MTGLDYAGPLYTKDGGKVWVCLFTCCMTRAVHLEIVTDLTTDAFLRCLRRFIGRRGTPSLVVSDNATTFRKAAKTVAKIVNHVAVKTYAANNQIQWKFNLEKAPWWGGFFERLIKTLKRSLKKTVGGAKLTVDEIQTALCEVELMFNT
ncbi:PREDICTED: uncharacterized protein LOC106820513 [Priapulus caudatus]|uniref:Uncharacterized protein LOC106820513 n=1 Tax=Priapulus caudatus TaxID=37621 RepID=A0ABM1F7U1_PRICU|nr:PREDICTED: uncharacterized protein LOC106820513 [Priapulus caudatus]